MSSYSNQLGVFHFLLPDNSSSGAALLMLLVVLCVS